MQTGPYKLILTALFGLILLSGTTTLAADAEVTAPPLQTLLVDATSSESACVQAVTRLESRQQTMQQDLRRLHREIAALRTDQAKPGLTEILGGIGYIIGLFGLFAWTRSRYKARL